MIEFESACEWIDALVALSKAPATTPEELAEWYRRAVRLMRVRIKEKVEVETPEIIWHYLSDADIRAKEPEYKEWQTRDFDNAIATMKTALAVKRAHHGEGGRSRP